MDNFDADLYNLLFSNSSNSQNTATSPMNTTVPNANVLNTTNDQNMNTVPMSNTVQNANNLNAVNNMTAPATNNALQNTIVSNVTDSKMKYVADKGSQLRQPKTAFPAETPVGMAFVPYQMWEKTYDCNIGFARATIFPSLDKPFIGEEAVPYERKR